MSVFMIKLIDAKAFLQAIAGIWTEGNLDLIEKYYAKDFQANYYGNQINYGDLVHRLNYLKLHQRDRKLEIFDVLLDQNKIAARFHYYAVDDQEGVIDTDGLAIYYLNDGQKIFRAWSFADGHVDYLK